MSIRPCLLPHTGSPASVVMAPRSPVALRRAPSCGLVPPFGLGHRALVVRYLLPTLGLVSLACAPAAPGTSGATETGGTSEAEAEAESEASGGSGTTTTGSSSTGDDTSSTSEATGPSEPALPIPCELAVVDGEAWLPQQLSFALPQSLIVLDPGDAEANTAARVMGVRLESNGSPHSEMRARTFELGGDWPDDVKQVASPLRLTDNGHYRSRMALLPGDGHRFAYLWTGDPDGYNDYDTFFSVLDVDAWAITDEVEVQSNTNASFVDLLLAPSGGRFVATYTTSEYDKILPGIASGFSLGILDASGAPLAGPAPLTEEGPYPGGGVRTFWAGDRLAVAIAQNECDESSPLCTPHAVVLAEPTNPDEDGTAVDDFAPTHVIDGLASTGPVSRPWAIDKFGLTWLLWHESEGTGASDPHRTLRAQVLDAGGDPLPWPPGAMTTTPISYVADQVMNSWPVTHVTEFGITTLHRTILLEPDELVSVYAFKIQHFDFEFQPLGEAMYINLTSYEAAYPGVAPLAHPRGLLLAWEEKNEEDTIDTRMMRLDCI